ncbi:MAG: hypothetical protein A2902_06760 [Elusimicrobia bacterium RIFCSPLOWO2_01_FULL_64_13]|nr:MAG: hypothetical protein A2902_06760 [Elusimicrobia bacterium RIFCSPLOWO2_01_FULL_64_13]
MLEKDLEQRIQNILDKVFGPNQSEVKANVTLNLLKMVQSQKGAGQQTRTKQDTPLGETNFILPGVPEPKNVAKEKDPGKEEKQQAEREKAQTQVSFKIKVSNREVIVFYNQKLQHKEPEARKAVVSITQLNDNELKFIPGQFFSSFSTFWEDLVRDPKNFLYAALLFLFLLLLLWLFIPLTNFFQNYIRAMKEKGGIEVKMESTTEDESMGKEGLTPEEIAAGAGSAEGRKEGDEAMVKKYVPFEYINEDNLKRLLGVFRKEPPQVIALVLSYLKPELVRQIYAELPPEIQTKVASETGSLRQATEEQVRVVDDNIRAKIDFLVGGVDNLIRILDEVDYKIRDNILEYLQNHRPQLYETVRSSLLLFDDVLAFPDPAVQLVIRELKTDQLAHALKKASPEMLNKFLSNMSQGGAALLKEEMEYGRAITDEQVEQEKQNILNTVRKMEEDGRIHVRDKKKISIFDSEDATSPLTPSMPEDDLALGRRGAPAADAPFAEARTGGGAAAAGASDYLAYGSQLYSESKFEEAIPYFQYAVEQDPSHAEALQLLGHSYYGLGMIPEALRCYDALLALTPEDEEMRRWVEQLKISAGV